MLFCFLRLYWVFIKSECLDVGSGKYLSAVNQPAIILIFKNIAFFLNCLLCLFWASFWLRDFGLFFLIVWFDWLFRLVVFYWTVVILCERRKINVWRCICIVAVVKPCVKMSAVWFKRLIFWFGRVLFVVKMLLCSERRFANDEKVKSFAK